MFNADKLMSILKVIAGAASKVNSTAATLNSVAEAYDGLIDVYKRQEPHTSRKT